MAIKPITNRQSKQRGGKVDRGTQLSTKRSLNKVGNRSKTVVPGGRDSQKGYSITLKDIDSAILSHIKEIIKPTVREANEVIKVPVMWGSEERWKMVRKNGVLRDKNGSLILPLIILKRTDTSMNSDMPLSFDHDVEGKYIQVLRTQKWSEKNRYDNFAIQTGTKPAYEAVVTGMPDFVLCQYTIQVFTNYMEQMNDLNALWVEHVETYWGGSTNYKFLSSLEGGISDTTEIVAEGERIIRNELNLQIKAYMIPQFTDNVVGKTSEIQRVISPSKVVFGFEGDATNKQVGK